MKTRTILLDARDYTTRKLREIETQRQSLEAQYRDLEHILRNIYVELDESLNHGIAREGLDAD